MNPPPLKPLWTPEQALAIYECLHSLAQQVWNEYEDQLLAPIVQNPDDDPPNPSQVDPAQPDLFGFNDDIPF